MSVPFLSVPPKFLDFQHSNLCTQANTDILMSTGPLAKDEQQMKADFPKKKWGFPCPETT